METEAKFTIPEPGVGKRLQASDRLAGFTLSSNGTKHIHDIYLDTPARQLLNAGYSCRYREQENGVVMTLKPLQTAEGTIHRREEVQARIPAGSISAATRWTVAEWPDPVRDPLLAIIGGQPLAPLVELNQTRLIRLVRQDERVVAEMSLDTVCAENAERHLAFLELEVELMPQGTEDELVRIAAVLEREWKLRPEPRSKFERVLAFLQDPPSWTGLLTTQEREICLFIAASNQPDRRRAKALLVLDEGGTLVQAAECAGFSVRRARYWERCFQDKRLGIFSGRLAEGTGTKPTDAVQATSHVHVAAASSVPMPLLRPGLTREDPMAEAARKTIQFHFRRMLEHEAGTCTGSDIEELHDMRVATRRMRAALAMFEDYLEPEDWKPFARMLRRSGRALGRVRDLDVFREKMQHYLEDQPAARQSELEPLRAAWEKEHAAARETLLVYLDGEAYALFKAEFGDFLGIAHAGARPVFSPKNEPQPHRIPHVLPVLLYQGLAEVSAYGDWMMGQEAPLTRYHQLRIASKRLRYSLEFFKEVLCPETDLLIAKVKALQDHLGDLQDAVVACEILRNFLIWGTWRRAGGPHTFASAELIIAPGVAAYLTARQTEIQKLKSTFPLVWAEVQGEEFRHRLGMLVQTL